MAAFEFVCNPSEDVGRRYHEAVQHRFEGPNILLLRELDMGAAHVIAGFNMLLIHESRQLCAYGLIGIWLKVPEVRKQQILNVQRVDGLSFEISAGNTSAAQAVTYGCVWNKPDVILQRHPPPKVQILNVEIESISSTAQRLVHIQCDCGMTDRQQISGAGDIPETFRRTFGRSEIGTG